MKDVEKEDERRKKDERRKMKKGMRRSDERDGKKREKQFIAWISRDTQNE